MPRWRWLLSQLTRRLWLRASLIGALGVVAAILAAVAERFIPWELPGSIRPDAVDSILAIIASSMLAVTTFSLSVTVSAYGSATSNVTPRATKLLMEDSVTQNALSTFIGSFLFGIVGIIVLKTGAYGDRGRVILFVMTILVIALIVVALLRWIDHLTRLGRVGETTTRVEQAAREAIQARLEHPWLGGRAAGPAPPAGAHPIEAASTGYVQHIDMPALSRCAEALGADIHLAVNPGAFAYPDTPLAWVAPAPRDAEEALAEIHDAFTLGAERNFDQDPRFGLAVMSEIGCRALSSATNDPGTAIDVIGRVTRLMALWAAGPAEAEVEYPRLHVPSLADSDLFEDAFMLMARDGAGLIEVQLRLQKSLRALARLGGDDFRAAAREQAELALARAEAAGMIEADRARLREVEEL